MNYLESRHSFKGVEIAVAMKEAMPTFQTQSSNQTVYVALNLA
jgi:hypothetical protein